MTLKQLRLIFTKTEGHCHFCGDKLIFERRGFIRGKKARGAWEVDHLRQRAKGGADHLENYLPACTECNRLRWNRTGLTMRRILRWGLLAVEEIKKASLVRVYLKKKMSLRLQKNKKRRRQVGLVRKTP